MKISKTANILKDDPRFQLTKKQQMIAACSGAIITSFLMTPLDVVKVRLQIQKKASIDRCFLYCNGLMDHYCSCHSHNFDNMHWYSKKSNFSGTFDAFIKITRYEGVSSLWSGLSPTLVLAIPATVLYFMSYDKLKNVFNKSFNSSPSQPIWIPLLAGCTARIWAATCVSPLELIRTKMQSEKLSYSEMHRVVGSLITYHGFLGLWKGLLPSLMRDVPFSGIYWVTYETIKSRTPKDGNPFLYSFLSGSIGGCVAAIVTTPFDVVKTIVQVDVMEKEVIKEPPGRGLPMLTTMRKLYAGNGVRGLFTGLTPRLVRVAPACAIMIGSYEFGKSYFYNRNVAEYLRNEAFIIPRKRFIS